MTGDFRAGSEGKATINCQDWGISYTVAPETVHGPRTLPGARPSSYPLVTRSRA